MGPSKKTQRLKDLVAENDCLNASVMARALEAADAKVAGPVATLAAALVRSQSAVCPPEFLGLRCHLAFT